MKNLINYTFLLLGMIFLMSFASGSGFWKIEKSESFVAQKTEILQKDIIFFQPEVMFLSVTDHIDRKFSERANEEEMARKYYKWVWKKTKFKGKFIDEIDGLNLTFSQYSDLLDLRREIIQANNLQNHPLDNHNLQKNDLSQSVFVNTPKIDFGLGALSEVVGSPYFALSGYINYNIKPDNESMRNFIRNSDINGFGNFHYYYCVVVNVETGEVIYREFKKLPLKLDAMNMKHFLYESYVTFKNNMEG